MHSIITNAYLILTSILLCSEFHSCTILHIASQTLHHSTSNPMTKHAPYGAGEMDEKVPLT